MLVAVILLFWLIYTALFVGCTALSAATFGLPIKEIRIGVGPALLRRSLPRFALSLHILPIAGSVAFGNASANQMAAAIERPSENLLDRLSTGQRILTAVAGPVSNAVLGLILLFTGFPSLIASGALGIYLALFNLLPLPALNGFEILVTLIPALRQRIGTEVPPWAFMLSLLIGLGCQTIVLLMVFLHPQILVEIGQAIVSAIRLR